VCCFFQFRGPSWLTKVYTLVLRGLRPLTVLTDAWKCGQPYQYLPVEKDSSTSLEAKSKKILDEYDKEKLANWKEGINYLLVVVSFNDPMNRDFISL